MNTWILKEDPNPPK